MTQPRIQSRDRPASSRSSGACEAAERSLHVVTFGCQMNQYDSLLVEGRFRARGYRVTGELEEADVILFNTCSVREHAEERVYSWVGALRRAKEQRPELVVGVMGCMAQRAEEEIFQRAAHVDLVCGTRQLQHLPELVDEVLERRRSGPPGSEARRLLEVDMDARVCVDRRREEYSGGLVGHLAVMRGCDLNCTFCIVPTVRGRVQSRTIEELVDEARWMVQGGARAITLLGQTVNSYGEDLPRPAAGEPRLSGRQGRPSLADLLRALQEIRGLERIRLITLHPAYVTEALARAIADCPKVDRFLPLPAQSGSDEVLRRMKRGYTTGLYGERLALLRAHVPDIELGSDWIVGFPGESEADFEATLAFLAEGGFVQNYVFQYSPRPGTKAASLEDDVPPTVKKARNHALLRAAERSALARMERWVGREARVFVERVSARDPALLVGRTTHNLPVRFAGDAELVGTTTHVCIQEASAFGLGGVALAGKPA